MSPIPESVGSTSSRRARRLIVWLLCLAVVAAACGGTDDADAPAADADAADDVGEVTEEPDAADEATEAEEPEEPEDPVSVAFRFDWIPTAKDVPVLAAEEFGWFEERNLDVSTTAGSGSNDSVSLTGAGEFQVAIAGASAVLTGMEQDMPVRSAGVVLQNDPMGYIAMPDSGIETPADFAGRTVGIQPESISYPYWQAIIELFDLDLDEITEVPVGFSPEPLLTGQIDVFPAFVTDAPYNVEQALSEEPVVLRASEHGIESLGQTLVFNTRFAEGEPEALTRFVDAYCQGMRWTIDNPEEAIDLVVDRYEELDPGLVEYEIPITIEFWQDGAAAENGLMYQDPEAWQTTYDMFRGVGYLERDLDVADAFTNEYLEDTTHCLN